MMRAPQSRAQSLRGATLIEVMVSLLIVSFGVLAMLALQTNAIKYTKTSEYRSIATLLANDLGDRMRVNRDGVTAGSYTVGDRYTRLTTIPARRECGDPNACTPSDLALRDVSEWRRALFFSLPGGAGFVRPLATNDAADVWIAWTDPGEANPADNTSGCPTNFLPTSSVPATLHCVYFRIAL